jgi:hypothetical protein
MIELACFSELPIHLRSARRYLELFPEDYG